MPLIGEVVVCVNAPVVCCAIPMGVNVSELCCAIQMGCKRFTCMALRCVLAELMCGCAVRKEGDSVLVLERAALAQRRASRRCCRVLEEKASGRQQVPMPWRCAQ